MRGINRVVISGNVSGSAAFQETSNGTQVASFNLASDRHDPSGSVVTAWVKVNVYIENLVSVCRLKLYKGAYVIVEGELMNREFNRDGQRGQLTEVRAWEIVFVGR